MLKIGRKSDMKLITQTVASLSFFVLHFDGFIVIYKEDLAFVVESAIFILTKRCFSSVLCQILQIETLISIFSKSQICIFNTLN